MVWNAFPGSSLGAGAVISVLQKRKLGHEVTPPLCLLGWSMALKPGPNFGQKESRLFPGEHKLPVCRGQQPGESGRGTLMEWGAGLTSLCLMRPPLVTASVSELWDHGDSFLALNFVASGCQHPVLPHPDFRWHRPLRDVSASRCPYASSVGQRGSWTPKTQPLRRDAGQGW